MRIETIDTRLGLAEEGHRLLIWSSSRTDREAAKKADVTSAAWTNWRNRRRLPPCSERTEEFLAVWRKAKSDPQAGSLLQIPSDAFRAWRRRRQLPPCLGNQNVRHAVRRDRGSILPPPSFNTLKP